jgi:hypothetical protein
MVNLGSNYLNRQGDSLSIKHTNLLSANNNMVGVDPQLQPWEIAWVNDAAIALNKDSRAV